MAGDNDDLSEVERWAFKGLKAGRDTVYDSKTGRATGLGTLIPVYAPALDAVADFKKGDYAGAALNTAFAVGDMLPIASVGKIANLGRRIGWENLAKTDSRYKAVRKLLAKADYVKPGQEVHHTRAIGQARNTPDWRNNVLMLKPMDKPTIVA